MDGTGGGVTHADKFSRQVVGNAFDSIQPGGQRLLGCSRHEETLPQAQRPVCRFPDMDTGFAERPDVVSKSALDLGGQPETSGLDSTPRLATVPA